MLFEDASDLFLQDDDQPERTKLDEDVSSDEGAESPPRRVLAPTVKFVPRAHPFIVPRRGNRDDQKSDSIASDLEPTISKDDEAQLREINKFMSQAMRQHRPKPQQPSQRRKTPKRTDAEPRRSRDCLRIRDVNIDDASLAKTHGLKRAHSHECAASDHGHILTRPDRPEAGIKLPSTCISSDEPDTNNVTDSEEPCRKRMRVTIEDEQD